MTNLLISDQAFAYLAIQRGRLADISSDRDEWQFGYEADLVSTVTSMAPHLPLQCRSVLDVGSGLGGVDVLLSRRIPGMHITLLDGKNDAPIVTNHRTTFSDMVVAASFLADNGIRGATFLSPESLDPSSFDLIISCASWCFHYEPAVYLDFVRKCCHAGTVLILEVRTDKPQWRAELEATFGPAMSCCSERKFERLVFRPNVA